MSAKIQIQRTLLGNAIRFLTNQLAYSLISNSPVQETDFTSGLISHEMIILNLCLRQVRWESRNKIKTQSGSLNSYQLVSFYFREQVRPTFVEESCIPSDKPRVQQRNFSADAECIKRCQGQDPTNKHRQRSTFTNEHLMSVFFKKSPAKLITFSTQGSCFIFIYLFIHLFFDRQAGRHVQTDGQTDRETDRRTDRQRER